MTATVLIRRITGPATSQTATDITGINTRANAYDTHSTADTTNPVQKPTSGLNYSYWVTTRPDCTVAPAGTIDNIRWFTDGSNSFGTGRTCKGNTATSYVQATGTAGTTGDQLTTSSHSGITATPVDVFTFTSGSPKSLTGSTSGTGQFGDYFVYQIEIGTTALAGAGSQEQFTYRYDET